MWRPRRRRIPPLASKRRRPARLGGSSLTEKHTWIPHEKGFFGCAGGDYDFAAREGGAARARADLDKLERAQDKLARKINKRVMGMIEKSERDYDDLTAKKATVARDRSKIEAVISRTRSEEAGDGRGATWRGEPETSAPSSRRCYDGAHADEPSAGAQARDVAESQPRLWDFGSIFESLPLPGANGLWKVGAVRGS